MDDPVLISSIWAGVFGFASLIFFGFLSWLRRTKRTIDEDTGLLLIALGFLVCMMSVIAIVSAIMHLI